MEKTKNKILIIDDDDEIRENYAEVFRAQGFEVLEAEDGVDGLDQATNNLPDIIFTGIMMPRMDGFGLAEALSKNVVTKDIPIVMNSHMGREEDRARAFSSGAKDFLIKGMDTPKDVLERIKIILNIKASDYKIKINPAEFDARRLANDLKVENGFICKNCGEEMIFNLKRLNPSQNNYSLEVFCPKCQK